MPRGVKKVVNAPRGAEQQQLPVLPREISRYEQQRSVPGGFRVTGSKQKGIIKNECMKCNTTHPKKGFAPIFSTTNEEGEETGLVLLCWDCYYT